MVEIGTGGGGSITIIGRPTTLRRLGGSVPLNPGQIVPIEPAWYDSNGNPVSSSGATVTFRDFSTGSARYWTGSAWTSTPTTLPTTAGRYVLTVPSAWLGLVVAVTASLSGQQDLTDTYTVDDTTTSRATLASVTALGTPAQASDLVTVQADTDALQTAVTALSAAVTALGSPAQATALASLVTTVGSPAQASALAALVSTVGTPAQASALAALVTAVGSPAQAVALTTAYIDLLAAINTRATPDDVEVTVTADVFGGRTA
jgi:hypothetical protein